MKIHPLADLQSVNIGEGTTIWQFAVILKGAVIGKNCNINCHTFIENDVIIGDNVTVKSGTFIWDSIRIADDVFIGPNVVFTNDLRPRSKQRVSYPTTTIHKGASIGANSTILAGVTIGKYAMTGIASVVTRNVPDYALVYGNPAKQHGWIDEKGNKLKPSGNNEWINEEGKKYAETPNGLIAL
jgi:UDP-2-acetamido-3-amino-2,3-dideoxy-glucuronate N-acetyltransferase